MKNYYEILGVDETATQDDIKKAYRQLSKQYHPDVNPEGEERFKEISVAYENIGEENKRAHYDNVRKNPFNGMGGGNNFDFDSIFEQMMGGRSNHRPKAPDKVLSFDITPVDSYFGSKKEIRLQNNVACEPCNGNGGDKKICDTCRGNGFVIQTFGTNMFRQQVQVQCPTCSGHGSILITPCKICRGLGVEPKLEAFMVNLPQNTDNGHFMRLRGKGDYYPNIKQRGDLIIKVNVVNDNDFEKMGDDLVHKVRLSPMDLILNEKLQINHPDGAISINIPDKIDTDIPLRIPNKGYMSENGRGHFYIKMSVVKDKSLNDEVKKKIKLALDHTN
jgi:molecular chaperone DnaJ